MRVILVFISVSFFSLFLEANPAITSVHTHNTPLVRQIRSLNPSNEADCQAAQPIISQFQALRVLFADGYRQMSFPLAPPRLYRCPCTSFDSLNSHGGVGDQFGREWQTGQHQIGGAEHKFIRGMEGGYFWGNSSNDPDAYPLEGPGLEVVPLNLNVGTNICHQLQTVQKMTEAFSLPAGEDSGATRGVGTDANP